MSGAFFARQEYLDRWTKVSAAMAASGYDCLLVWQRSAGTYDRVGDVRWLTNFQNYGTGQDPASEEQGAPYTFAAVLVRRGHEPELHTGLEDSELDLSTVVCGRIVCHGRNLMTALADHLREQRIEGRIAVVGDDILPGPYDRLLRRLTPQVEWVADDTFLLGPQMIKSARELEAYRIAGDLATRSMDAAMRALIAGESGAEAASRAAGIIVRAGGGFHRIDVHHGPASEHQPLSSGLYGYDTRAPAPGDIVRCWIYGPLFEGYWLDPGRSAVCGNRPTSAQKRLIEGAAAVVDDIVAAVSPGVTPRQLGIRGGARAREFGYFDHPQLNVPLLGHGLGTFFVPYVIPLGEGEPDPTGAFKYDQPLRPGMVMAAEIFLTHPSVGTAGFEQNFIVTDTGADLLSRTPMIFW